MVFFVQLDKTFVKLLNEPELVNITENSGELASMHYFNVNQPTV